MTRKYLFLDFEFYGSHEKDYRLVCCHTLAFQGRDQQFERAFWLHNQSTQELVSYLNSLYAEGYIFVAWVASAELRCLLTAGLDIDPLLLIDVQVEYKLFCNSSRHLSRERNLHAAAVHFMGAGSEEKADLRDLILSAEQGYKYTKEDARRILAYCRKDVILTRDVFQHIAGYLVTSYGLKDTYIEDAMRRGEYIRATTYVERNGYPVHIERLQRIGAQFDNIQLAFIKAASDDVRNCYVLEIKNKKYKAEKFVFKKATFEETVKRLGLADGWARTPGGSFTTDSKWLKDNSHLHPFIEELHSVKRRVDCLKYLRPKNPWEPNKNTIYDALSSDERVRCYVNPFGTKTGRNAPPATYFIPAQASWERVLISPKPGKVILAFDYAAQETLISAILTNDKNMLESYKSGDIYLAFGKFANLIPEDATKYTHGDIRTKILKPVVLGLSYGMGVGKLAGSIKRSREEAQQYYNAHQTVYSAYWDNTREFLAEYRDKDVFYRLSDDWGFRFLDNHCTLINWRAQSWGGRILRRLAVDLTKPHFQTRKIALIILLHDAIYVELPDDEKVPGVIDEIKQLMIDIFHSYLPSEVKVRVDCEQHRHDDLWIEEKAETTWEAVKPFVIGE